MDHSFCYVQGLPVFFFGDGLYQTWITCFEGIACQHNGMINLYRDRQAMLAKPGDQLFLVVDVSKCPATLEVNQESAYPAAQ